MLEIVDWNSFSILFVALTTGLKLITTLYILLYGVVFNLFQFLKRYVRKKKSTIIHLLQFLRFTWCIFHSFINVIISHIINDCHLATSIASWERCPLIIHTPFTPSLFFSLDWFSSRFATQGRKTNRSNLPGSIRNQCIGL